MRAVQFTVERDVVIREVDESFQLGVLDAGESLLLKPLRLLKRGPGANDLKEHGPIALAG